MSRPVRHVRRSLLPGLFALAAVLGVSSPASAQDAATVKRLEQMNKRAMEDYDLLEFDSARKTLTDAVALVRSSGLEDSAHGIAAKTYINLGVVYIGGFKDKDRGRMQFVRALKIKGDARLDPQVATPELQEVFNEALREMGKKPGRPPKPEPVKPEPVKPEPVKPEPVKPTGPVGPEDIEPSGTKVEGLAHEPLSEARSGFPIVVKAEVGADITAGKVLLFYRGTGREDYLLIPMAKNRKGVYVAQIPADQVTGKVLQYYIEVRDNRGRPQVANGSAGSPNIISIVEASGDGSTVDGKGDDTEDPLKRRGTRFKKREDEKPVPTGPKRRRFWITAGIGTGFGLAYGYSECAWNEGPQSDGRNYSGFCVIGKDAQKTKISPGFATAPLHVAPEFGLYITEHWAVSLQGRFQVLTLADAGAATAAPAGVARGLYFFGIEKFRYYLSFALGGGMIRHTVPLGKVATLAEDEAIKSRNIKDTVMGGYVLFGPGFGITYEFSKYVGLMAELNAWAGVPKITFNLDINVGLTLNF
jgi:hypothetical protein